MRRRLAPTMVRMMVLIVVLLSAWCWAADVSQSVYKHFSKALGREKQFTVFYPYQFKPGRRYPVLYLLHGYGGKDDGNENSFDHEVIMTALKEHELFVIVPDGGVGWFVDSPYSNSKYETYLIEELIPFVDKKLPTMTHRQYRGICGVSMGGHGAITLAFKHPQLFGSASSLSGILDLVRHSEQWNLAKLLGPLDKNRKLWEDNSALYLSKRWGGNPPIALFIECGVEDYALWENRDFHSELQKMKIPHRYEENPGAHTLEYWFDDGHLAEHLRFHSQIFSGYLFADKWPWVAACKTVNVKAEIIPIDLKPYVTTGFTDEVEGDRKGGWTDQGKNDLRMLPVGNQEFLGVPMQIIDPARNNGKSCIVLAGPSRHYFPKKVEGIAVNKKFSRLFFLHTLAWSSGKIVGQYRVHYQDQTMENIDIIDGINIGDWWFPQDLPQAPVAYNEKNPMGHGVGLWLFTWENPKPEVPIIAIDFISNGASVPALVAISGEKVAD